MENKSTEHYQTIIKPVFVMYSCLLEPLFSKFYYLSNTIAFYGVTMGEKIIEATKYLYGCLTLEKEANLLYITVTKKLTSPQLSIVTTALAIDNQKHAAIIQQLLNPVHTYLGPEELPKQFKKNLGEISKLLNTLTIEDTIEDEEINELLKTLTNLEDCLHDSYDNFIESKLSNDYAKVLSGVSDITSENLEYTLKLLKQDELKHREMLIESLYFHSKYLQRNQDTTPIVKYQNPNAWIQL